MIPAIEMKSVSKRFGNRMVLDQFQLTIEKGSIFALLGDNGTGKSTTMKLLTGQIQPDSGSIEILGQNAWKNAITLRHQVGYVPEKPKYYDWMTVAQLGRFIAGFHYDGFLNRFFQSAERLGLDTSRRLSDLSKGGYARAGLALALAIDPQVLLLDEPTSGLDLSTRREFLAGMVDLAADGRSILITSHQIAEVERIASHVGLMVGGRLVMCHSMDDLKAKVVQLTIHGRADAHLLPGVGTVLKADRIGQIWRGVVIDPDPTLLQQVVHENETMSFQIQMLSLEEIYEFVISHHGSVSTTSNIKMNASFNETVASLESTNGGALS